MNESVFDVESHYSLNILCELQCILPIFIMYSSCANSIFYVCSRCIVGILKVYFMCILGDCYEYSGRSVYTIPGQGGRGHGRAWQGRGGGEGEGSEGTGEDGRRGHKMVRHGRGGQRRPWWSAVQEGKFTHVLLV